MATEIRRDVSWTVVIRIERTGNWIDWSTGHRSVPEVLAVAETLVTHPAIAEIRFDRIAKTQERFSLADLGEDTDKQPDPGRRIPLPGIPECGPDCFCRRGDTEGPRS